MYESQVPLLENEELFITLQTSQRTSLEVKEALITSQVTEKEIDAARAVSTYTYASFANFINTQTASFLHKAVHPQFTSSFVVEYSLLASLFYILYR